MKPCRYLLDNGNRCERDTWHDADLCTYHSKRARKLIGPPDQYSMTPTKGEGSGRTDRRRVR